MTDTPKNESGPPPSQDATGSPSGRRFPVIPAAVLPWLVAGLLAGAIGLVYGRALHAPFIFDDHPSIVTNTSIQQLWPLWDGRTGWTPLSAPIQSATAARPLVNLTLAVNYALGGLDPFGYHLFNMGVHTLAAVILWALVRRTLRLPYFQERFDRAADVLAFLVALIWAVHPLQTEAVEYITQRTELLVGLFYLATVYCSLRYFTTGTPALRTTWSALATAACLLGMTCKEVMVTAPVMVLLFERTFVAGSFRKALENSWRLYLGLSLSWILLAALNYSGPRSHVAGFGHGVPLAAYWLTQVKALEMYLTLVIWPWPLVIYHELPLYTNPLHLWPALLVVGVLAINTIIRLWSRGATGYLGAWVFVILSPTLVVPILTENAAERRMYLPLAAIAVLAVVGGYALLQNLAQQKAEDKGRPRFQPLTITAAGALVVAGLLGVISARRLDAYRSAVVLWQDALAHLPDNYRVLGNLARELLLEGNTQEARQYYERAVKLKPGTGHRDWAITLFQVDRPDEGLAHYEDAIRSDPNREPLLREELGLMLLDADQPQKAAAQFARVVRLAPDSAQGWRYLGIALSAAGRPQEAIEALLRAKRFAPDSAEVEQLLARARNDARRATEAVTRLRLELEKEPDLAELHSNLGSALLAIGRFDEAIHEFQQALKLRPDFPTASEQLQQAMEAKQSTSAGAGSP